MCASESVSKMWMGMFICIMSNAKLLCTCMYMCSCVIVCHPSPLQSAYHLAKTEVLSQQLQTLGLQPDKVRCVYVGEGDRRETVVSCVRPSLLFLSYPFLFHPNNYYSTHTPNVCIN